jgi:hypothetical protein
MPIAKLPNGAPEEDCAGHRQTMRHANMYSMKFEIHSFQQVASRQRERLFGRTQLGISLVSCTKNPARQHF